MRTFRWLSFVSLVFLSAACGRDKITLQDFDQQVWKADRNACEGKRSIMYSQLLDQKQQLLAHGEIDIVDVLGKPDENELYKRNEKFYYYYVDPAKKCGGDSAARRLVIRFNAVGLAKEILVE